MIRRDLVATLPSIVGMRWTSMSQSQFALDSRSGSAWEDGYVEMVRWNSVSRKVEKRTRKCRSYRQAVRILSYFVRGVNP